MFNETAAEDTIRNKYINKSVAQNQHGSQNYHMLNNNTKATRINGQPSVCVH